MRDRSMAGVRALSHQVSVEKVHVHPSAQGAGVNGASKVFCFVLPSYSSNSPVKQHESLSSVSSVEKLESCTESFGAGSLGSV